MLSVEEFETLLGRLRNGDEEAARACVRHFEPEIRRAARVRLRDPRLRPLVDSIDISQSVFRRFFAQVQQKPQALDEPEQLLALLVTMTRNRVIDWSRKRQAERRAQWGEFEELERIGKGAEHATARDPSEIVADQELVDAARARLTPIEIELFDRRARGESWEDIGATMRGSAEALRKRLERALRRVRAVMEKELS